MLKHELIVFLACSLLLTGCQTLRAIQDDFLDVRAGNISPPNMYSSSPESLLKSECPEVQIVDDLSSLSDFTSPNKQYKEHLISRVDLISAESTCKLASKSVIVDLKLIFNGTLGAKGRQNSADKPFFSYPYFVAVTAPNGKIMAKEIFAASVTFNPNENNHSYYEKLRQIIPIDSKERANLYKILIGFQVTPDQLAYNRNNMVSLKK